MRRLFALLGILGGVIPVAAQVPPPVVRDQLVVSATLAEEEESDLPASVAVIDADEIAARQATAVADLLATVAGVGVVRAGSPGQVTSLFVRGTESDHTLVLWNGIELNDPYFGGYNWAFLPTEGVERVEVVRGPFSSLYGSDALGGVVQILSGSEDGGSVSLEAGDHGYARAAVTAGGELGRARFDVAGHARRGGGRFGNDFFDGEQVVARARWTLGEGRALGLVARAGDAEVGIPFSGGAPAPERRLGWRELELAVPFEAELGAWSVDARLSRVATESAFRDPDDPFGFTSADTRSEALRARAVARWRRDGWWLAVGGERERLRVDDASSFGVALAGAEQETWAVFGELFYRAGPVRLDLGLRHDDNDVFGARTTPKLGVAVALPGELKLHAAWGEGFRAPSVGELFFPGSGNPGLEPEESESVEIGLGGGHGAWSWGVTGFENRLRNLIDFDFATFTNVNVGRARTRGVEARLGWRGELRGAAVSLEANATRLDAVDLDTGLALLRRPEDAASLVATVRPGPWTLNLTALYVGARDDVDPVSFGRARAASWTRIDLAARYRLSERLAPYARLENAADRGYVEALGFPAPGRTVVGGIAIGF